ncbi:MAG: leucine-rich repeat domain-containing protein [Planctomycetota bacterium]|nr:MAG: leucine-rich repeat domain-containing protein [Planctomycetota bacterium]
MLAAFVLSALPIVSSGCGDTASAPPVGDSPPPVSVAPARAADPRHMTVSELRERLKAANPGFTGQLDARRVAGEIRSLDLYQSGVTDITPLKGLPLRALDLTGLPVEDLSPLEGMPLRVLILEGTRVRNLTPLKGMALEVLKLQSTPVTDLSPIYGMPLRELNLMNLPVEDVGFVKDMPLETLWLVGTRVKDLSPLRGKRLVSLDIQDTPVADLSPLRGMTSLKRLNIAGSAVTDLTPLEGLALERLIFTPERIEKGLPIVRNMPSLNRMGIGRSFETVMPPAQFWAEYDRAASETKSSSGGQATAPTDPRTEGPTDGPSSTSRDSLRGAPPADRSSDAAAGRGDRA